MLVRFIDMQGREWEVWETGARPALADRRPVRRPRAGGEPPRLCFESATQRRQLARYPAGWHAMGPAQLTRLCEEATPTPLPRALRPPFVPPTLDVPEGGP